MALRINQPPPMPLVVTRPPQQTGLQGPGLVQGPADAYLNRTAGVGGVNGGLPVGNPNSTSVTEAFPGANLSPNSSEADLRAMIRQDLMTANPGKEPTETDYQYWLPKLRSDCDSSYVTSGKMTSMDYWHNRMLGWQAGGPDTAKAGPYAGQDFDTGGSSFTWPDALDPNDPLTAQRKELETQMKSRQEVSRRHFEDIAKGAQQGTYKADAYHALAYIDPNAPGALDKAVTKLNAKDPGSFWLEDGKIKCVDGGSLSNAGGAWSWSNPS